MSTKKDTHTDYISNPFSITFKGLGLLIDFAQGVFITLLIIGLFGTVFNIFGELSDTNSDFSTTESSNLTTTNGGLDFEPNLAAIAGIILLVSSIVLVLFAIAFAISAAFKGFSAAGAVAASEQRKITVGQALNEMTSRFGTLYYAEAVTTAKIIGGYLLFIIPGVRAQLRYQSTALIILRDKNLSAPQAITKSKQLYRGHLMEVLGIMTVGAIIPFIGQALSVSGLALSVEQVERYTKEQKKPPAAHWLNYIGFIVFVLIVFFAISIALLLAAAR